MERKEEAYNEMCIEERVAAEGRKGGRRRQGTCALK